MASFIQFRERLESLRAHLPTLRAIALTSSARAYSAATTIIGLILTVRWLGPEGRGIVVVVTTWVTVVASLGSLSLWQVSVHRGAQGQGKPWLGPFLGALLAVSSAATVIGWAVVALLARFAGTRLFEGIPLPALALGFAALPFLIWEFFANSLLSVVGRLGFHNLNQIVGRTVGLVSMIVLVRFAGLGVYGFLIAFLSTEVLLSGAGVAVLLRRATGRLRDGLRQLPGLIRDGLKMHLQIIGALLYSSVDILLVYYFHGAAAAAVYQFASGLFLALLLIPQSAVLALQGKAVSTPIEQFWWEHRLVIFLVCGLMALIAIAGWFCAPWVAVLVGTSSFREAGEVLRIFMFALPAAAFVWMMTVQWLARGHFFSIGFTYLAMGMASVTLNLLLIPGYGARGAAIAAVIMWNTIPLVPSLLMARAAQREARSHRLHSGHAASLPLVPELPPLG